MKKNVATHETNLETNEKYFAEIFSVIKKMETLSFSGVKNILNDSEIRLLSEIVYAKCNGEGIISAKLAKRLGITRSAVSQMVNKLEEKNIVKRVADDVDRKIAYIDFTDKAMEVYLRERQVCVDLTGKIIETFGEEKLRNLIDLCEEFSNTVSDIRKNN